MDKVYQKANEIENSMSKMEQQIKLMGGGTSHGRRKSDGNTLLIRHKPNTSAIMSQIEGYSGFNNSPDNSRSALSAQLGQRNKVTRLMIK